MGAGLWQVREAREPVHEGQKLSEWMERHLPSSAANPPYGSEGWKKAHEAIRNIGTNGIPTLLKMISATDNGFKRRFLKWASTQPRLHLRYRPAYQLNEEAEYAIEILGTNAVGAVPGLTKIYQDARSESSQRCTALALGHIGRGARTSNIRTIRCGSTRCRQ